MGHIKLEIDDETHQRLSIMFKGDEKAMHDFVVKSVTEKLAEIPNNESEANADTKSPDLEDYLKSGKSGSRPYGIKGQGW